MHIQTKLTALHRRHHASNTCTLKHEATQPVFGFGNPKANIVFIGEAPGKKEDQTGVPFVGAAGKLLDTMLASININRADIYITNTVKYRPPNNRDPKPEEAAACFPWLSEELALIKPKLIVFLGRHALHRYFPEAKISEVHGTLLQKNIPGIPTQYFLPLYHPAAALYNGSMRTVLMEDFAQIPKVLKKITQQKTRNTYLVFIL